ncbi:MAG: protein kinase, partial [Planctomycetes bacterium]|nr:protein kinase [Planctomycetota bacterium]
GHESDLRRDVAIKVLQRRYAERPDVLARFVEEAQIGGQLQHPGVVPVYELGVLADQRPYFTMKLVKGETLAARLAQRTGDAAERRPLLDVFLAVCHTIAYAHSRRVIHRDLKPANVMVGSFGEVQVVDWGLAKVLPRGGVADERPRPSSPGGSAVIATLRTEPGSAGASVAGSVLGTPSYMPPEQARGSVDELDERSDVFALGAILCEILTGEPPYGTEFRTALLMAATADLGPARARLAACGADAALVALCEQCLAPAPSARLADAGVLARVLQQYLAAVEQRARDAQIAAAAATERAAAARRTRNLTLALATTVVAALGLGGGGLLWVRAEAAHRLQEDVERVRVATATTAARRGEQRWVEAAAAARTAVDLLPAEAPEALAKAVRSELAELELRVATERAATERVEADARLLRELRTLAEPDGGRYAPTDWTRVDRAFAGVFAAHGLVPDGDEAATAAVVARGLGEPLAQSLVEWAAVRRHKGDPDGVARLLRLALRVDPDPDRVALRSAVLANNAEAVVALAKAPTVLAAPPATLVELVRALRAVGRVGEALDVQVAACLRHPTDSLLAFEVAGALSAADRSQEAVRLLHGALAARPDALPVRRSLACAYEVKLREYATAEAFVRESLRRHPDDAYLHQRLASCLLAQERIDPLGMPTMRQPSNPRRDEAIEALRAAIRLGAHPDYHQVLANALSGLGRFADAVAVAQEGLALLPHAPCDVATEVHLNYSLGAALDRLGRFDEAMVALQRAFALGPDEPTCVVGFANLQARTDPAAATATCRAFLARRPASALVLTMLSRLLQQANDVAGATEIARQATEADPGDLSPWVDRVSMLREMGKLEEALAVCDAARALHPDNWELVDLMCWILSGRDRSDELRGRLRDLLAKRPDHPVAHSELGRIALQAGDVAGALAGMRRAQRLGLESPSLRINLAAALLHGEGAAAALAECDIAVAHWPDLAAVHHARANVLSRMERFEEALRECETAVRLAPGRPFALEALAWAELRCGHATAAAATAKRALEPAQGPPVDFEPNGDPEFALTFSTELIEPQPALAAGLLRLATERTPGSAEAWCNLGHALAGSGRHAEAVVAMARGHELGSAAEGWQYPSDQWLDRCRFFAAAEAQWETGLRNGTWPQRADERLGMAKWLLARGNDEAALQCFQPLLDDHPEQRADSGLHLDVARALVRLAAHEPAAARGARYERARAQL